MPLHKPKEESFKDRMGNSISCHRWRTKKMSFESMVIGDCNFQENSFDVMEATLKGLLSE